MREAAALRAPAPEAESDLAALAANIIESAWKDLGAKFNLSQSPSCAASLIEDMQSAMRFFLNPRPAGPLAGWLTLSAPSIDPKHVCEAAKSKIVACKARIEGARRDSIPLDNILKSRMLERRRNTP